VQGGRLAPVQARAFDDVDRRPPSDERHVDRALAVDAFLSEEQKRLVRRLTLEGDGVAVIVGKAGTGKTTALSTARAAWVDAGVPVIGCAVSRRAAQELEAGGAIPSTSVAALLHSLGRPESGLPAGAVLVVDEAGLLGTRDAARLLGHVDDAQGKLVLAGDTHQLPSIAAGGLLAGLATRLEPIELSDNRRQRHAWRGRRSSTSATGTSSRRSMPTPTTGASPAADRHQAVDRLAADWQATGDLDAR
jgi:ATP-dependent exoDNAse (exonuclease V) alpha subunit